MSMHGFALFDTAIGCCGIAWTARGIAGVQLPERDEAATRSRMARRFPAMREQLPSPMAQQAIDAIRRLLDGEAADLTNILLDINEIPPFRQQLYTVLRGIPPGATITYGALAARLGEAIEAREVGEAMGRNPFPIIVPCHRVVGAGGTPGGFSAPGGVATKLRMLNIEQSRWGERAGLFGTLPLAVAPPRGQRGSFMTGRR